MATEQELQELFNRIDFNQDGKISIEELVRDSVTTGLIPQLTQSNFIVFLQEEDSDKDGSISFEELKKAAEKEDNLNN